jgi:hypothetical protein
MHGRATHTALHTSPASCLPAAAEDINLTARDDLGALSALLGENAFLLGPAPCYADASLFATLEAVREGGRLHAGLSC